MGRHTDIAWRPWNREAFDEAKATGKPILLDLSAVWCHWCHVMDNTSYSDDQVIDLIRKDFIPVRVDIDKRPDIRDRYSLFGGWPTTAFLNYKGEVVTGATYIPPQQMLRVLPEVKKYFDQHKGDPPVQVGIHAHVREAPPEGEVSEKVAEDVLGHILVNFDEAYGGLGMEPKFPHPEPIDLVLRRYWEGGNREFLQVATTTLDRMHPSGTYDSVEGGFFRYSTTQDWSVPHYEKMCEVNAGLLRNYAVAHAITGSPRYRAVAEDILRYLREKLSDPKGGFYGSQDADEEYYKLDTPEARSKRKAPLIDKTFYADLNGMMAYAHLVAASYLGDAQALGRALKALDRIVKHGRKPDGLLYHHFNGHGDNPGLLADHAWMARALLEAYGVTGEERYLDWAQDALRFPLENLKSPSGAFFDRKPSEEEVGLLRRGEEPIQDNALLAEDLLVLADLTAEDAPKAMAHGILKAFLPSYDRFGFFAAGYARAVDQYLKGSTKVVVVAIRGDKTGKEFRQSILGTYLPRRILLSLDPSARGFERWSYPATPAPAAYVCVGTSCSSPILPGGDLAQGLKDFTLRAEASRVPGIG